MDLKLVQIGPRSPSWLLQQQIKPWKTFDGFFLQNGQNCGFPRPRWSFSSFVIQLISWQPWCCDNIYLNYLQCRLQNTHERILERLSCWYRGSLWPKKNWPQFCPAAKNGQQSRRYRELTNCFFYFIPELPFYQAKLHLGSSRLFLTQNWPKKTDLNSGGDQKERSTEQIQIRADKVLFLRII